MAPLTAFLIPLLSVFTAVNAQYTNQSAPFTLSISSPNTTYDGAALYSCHEGAAIEGLCVTQGGTAVQEAGSPTGSQYYLNYSTYTGPDLGWLTYYLPVTGESGPFNESEALIFEYNPASNVALPLFFPGSENAQTIGFTDDNIMYVPEYIDDTVTPPTYLDPPANLTRWYVCETNNEGYDYITLAWLLGSGTPENPSCVPANVVRTFV